MKRLASTLWTVALSLSSVGTAFSAAPPIGLATTGAELGGRTLMADASRLPTATVEATAAPAAALGGLTTSRTCGLLFIGLAAVGMGVHRRSRQRD